MSQQQRCSICKEVGHKKTFHNNTQSGKTRCYKCKQEFPTDAFPKRPSKRADGTRIYQIWPVCRECNKENGKSRYRNSFRQRLEALARTAQRRAEKRGIPFDIDIDYLMSCYEKQNGLCAYSGIALSLETDCDNSVSIDQIYPSQGYIKGNVALTCRLINNMKTSMNKEQFLGMCKAVLKYCNE